MKPILLRLKCRNMQCTFVHAHIFFLMIRRPPRSTRKVSSAASDVYKGRSSDGVLLALAPRLRGLASRHRKDSLVAREEEGSPCRRAGLLCTSPSPRDGALARMPALV